MKTLEVRRSNSLGVKCHIGSKFSLWHLVSLHELCLQQFTSSISLGKLLNCQETQFPHLQTCVSLYPPHRVGVEIK